MGRIGLVVVGVVAVLMLAGSPARAQLCGDADGDGSITDVDGVNALRAGAGLSSACTLDVCDVNADGVLNDTDAVNVLRAAASLPATLACAAPVDGFIDEIETQGGEPGQLVVGAAPIPGASAATTIGTLGGNTTVVAGGSNTISVPYDTTGMGGAQAAANGNLFMVIAIADLDVNFFDGYFIFPLDTPVGVVTFTVVFPQDLGTASFLFCPATLMNGVLSQYGALRQDPMVVGAGVLQVSLSFQPSQDLDLHLIEPAGGQEIFFGNRTSTATGGHLDLDSNPACFLDNVNNENITYGPGSSPIAGQYVVRVVFFQNCTGMGANFTVVLNNAGVTSSADGSFAANEQGASRDFVFTFPP
jgi:hypothetical protein